MPGSTNPVRENSNSAWLLFLAAAHAAIKQCPHVSPVLHSSNHLHRHNAWLCASVRASPAFCCHKHISCAVQFVSAATTGSSTRCSQLRFTLCTHSAQFSAPARTGTDIVRKVQLPRTLAQTQYADFNSCAHLHKHSAQISAPAHTSTDIARRS